MKKLKNFMFKYSGILMALVICVAKLSENSTCMSIFNQPKVPEALLKRD
mgnify:CR=1 FL=1